MIATGGNGRSGPVSCVSRRRPRSLRSKAAKSWCPSIVGMGEAAAAAPHHRPKRAGLLLLVRAGGRVERGVDRGGEIVVGSQGALIARHELGDLLAQRLGCFLFLRGHLALGARLRLGRGLLV